jgi:hypothetical protein
MGLLNPVLLALGLAAAVPLLLHLLQRQQGPRVVFPAVRYLRRAERESARRIRLRQVLLLLLRATAMVLVALAASRPFIRAAGAAHAPTAVALVLDNSMSTAAVVDGRRVLDDLKERALEMLDRAGPDDRFWLLRTGSAEPALAGDAAATALRVRETEPGAAAPDMAIRLVHAAALLSAGADGRATEIHLLTDLQAAAFPTPAEAPPGAPSLIVWHPGSPPPDNRTVVAVEVSGGFSPVVGERATLAAAIDGDGDDPVSVRLYVEGELTAAAMAPPGAAAVLTLPPAPASLVTGYVEIDADALRADDRRWFAVRAVPPPAVALAAEAPFLNDALAVLADAGRIRLADPTSADVSIHPAAMGMPPVGAARTAVVLPPDDGIALPAANARLAAAGIPWRIGQPAAGGSRLGAPDDPLLRGLDGFHLRLVYTVLPERPDGSGAVYLRLDDDTPWAVGGERAGGGRYILIGSPLTPDASAIPVSAVMLPLLDRLTGAWAAQRPARTEVLPGDVIVLPDEATAVESPDGSRVAAPGGAEYRIGTEPGVYRVLAGDTVAAALAVNPDPAASRLARLDRRSLEARLPGWRLHVTSDAGGWRRAIFRERIGREFWKPLVLALLLVLAVETAVAAAGPVRGATPQAARASEGEPG